MGYGQSDTLYPNGLSTGFNWWWFLRQFRGYVTFVYVVAGPPENGSSTAFTGRCLDVLRFPFIYDYRWWFQLFCLFWSNLTSIFWCNHQVDDIWSTSQPRFLTFFVESLKPKNLPKCHSCYINVPDTNPAEPAGLCSRWKFSSSVNAPWVWAVWVWVWGGLGRFLGKVACGDVFLCVFLHSLIEIQSPPG